MAHASALKDVLFLLIAAVAIVATFRQLRLSPVLGFLFAGAIIGPHGLEIVGDVKQKTYLAEFGIVLLLFVIGLELSFKKLAEMRAYVLGIGGLQFIITTLLGGVLLHEVISSWEVAFLISGALSLSSTAIVLQLLDERGQRMSQTGRVSFSVLLLQDLSVIPLLIILKILAQQNSPSEITNAIADTFLRGLGAIVLLLILGKIFIHPIFRLIAKSKNSDLFVATTLLVVLGSSFVTEAAGLSLALGAFIAGLTIAETEFKKQVEADIMPFKGLLMGLFFMTVGMGFNYDELIRKWPEVLLFSFLLVVGKALIIAVICKIMKMGWETSLRTAILLGQGSEFAFVLLGLAIETDLLKKGLGQVLLIAVTISMAITPLIYGFFHGWFKKLFRKSSKYKDLSQTEDLQNHVIICGFGWVGENVAKFLSVDNINFVAIDQSPVRVRKGRQMGFPVYYGDGARADILKSLKADKAKAIVITIHDSRPVKRVIQTAHTLYPEIPIIARAKHLDAVDGLKDEGASIVVPEAFESSIQVGRATLALLGTSPEEVTRLTRQFRDKLYQEFETLKGEGKD